MLPQSKKGFTLIEVLISLVILSIALTAIIKVTSQTIRDTSYVQNKLIANWVGTTVMNEILAGVLKISNEQAISENTQMLKRQFAWEAKAKETPNKHIREIDVDVFDQSKKIKYISLVSYENRAQS